MGVIAAIPGNTGHIARTVPAADRAVMAIMLATEPGLAADVARSRRRGAL